MSVNQSRAEKSGGHVRKTGRSGSSGHNKGFHGGSGKGGSGSGSCAAPLHSPSPLLPSNPAPPLPSNRRKPGHGEHFRGTPAVAASSNAGVAGPATKTNLAVPNGAHTPAALPGSSDPPVLTTGGKPVDAPMNSRAVLKAPSSIPASGGLDAAAAPPTTSEGDASRSFTLQFGTINPGIVTGMQIPARTSSAPPNLDEQKRDQVRQDPFRAVPMFPIPPVPKHQPPQMRKNGALASQNADVESNLTQMRKDGHTQIPDIPVLLGSGIPVDMRVQLKFGMANTSQVPPASLPKASVLPGSGIPVDLRVQLKPGMANTSQVPPASRPKPPLPVNTRVELIPGVVANTHELTQAASSLQMPLALPVANAPQVPQQLFAPGLQAHSLQAQALIHQGQGLGFPQMSHQMSHHQIGNLGIAIGPQFSQQQTGKFGGQRKTTVKITHPETHEELRLDKRSDSYSDGVTSSQKSLPNLNIQSQPVPSFISSHQVNYYPQMQTSTFIPSPIFYPPSSITLTSTQIQSGTQVPKYSYSVGQGGQPVPFMSSSTLNPISGSKPGTPMQVASESVKLDPLTSSATPAPVQVSIKPPNSKIEVGKSSLNTALPTRKAEEAKSMKLPVEVSTSDKPKDQNAALSTQKAEEAKSMKLPVEVSTSNKLKDQNAVYDSYQFPKPVSAESEDATSSRVVDSDSIAPTALPSVRKEPILIPSVTATGDSASVVAGSDGRKKELIRRSNSMKEQHRKSSKKDIRNSQQQHQASIMEPSDFVKLNTSKSAIDNSTVDALTTEQSENSEKFQVISMASPATSTLPPSHSGLEPTLPPGEAAEFVQDPSDGMDAISSAVLGEEVLQETCLTASDSSESFHMVMAKDEYEFGMPTSVNDVDKDIPNFSEVMECQEEHNADVVVSKPKDPQTVVKEENDVSRETPLDNCNAKVYPIPAFAELLESEKSIVSAGEEVEDPSKRMALVSVDAEHELAVTCKELGNNLGVDGVEQPHESTNAAVDIVVEGKVEQLHRSSNASDENIVPPGSINDTLLTGILEGNPSPSETTTYENVETSTHEVCSGDLVDDSVSSGTRDSPQDVSSVYPTSKECLHLEPARAKTTVGKKKRRKDILSKADLAVPSDLYGAYKGPEEKLDDFNLESMSRPPDGSKDVSLNDANKATVPSEEEKLVKSEVDDWEDAVEDSTPKLASHSVLRANGAMRRSDEHGSEAASKRKYSRDFLLTLKDQCEDLPVGFEIGSDIANALMCTLVVSSDRESFPSPGRGGDRSQGGSRGDRRMGGIVEDDKRSKPSGPFGTGQGHGSFRQGEGANHGVLRNQRGQASGGIIVGPVQSIPPQGGAQRNGADADRWQRYNSIQRGIISPPQSPLQVMHKAAKRYEVGKVSDEEEAKQRQLKAILNKLTPQNFEKLFAQVIDVNIDNARTLTGVISQIFDKALMEPTFCEMYANFCLRLSSELPDFSEDNEKITFKRLLLNKCQEEFERHDREQAEANKAEEEGEIQLSDVQKEEKRIKARRRMLGNIRLIGELYKKKMLTERIMHECIKKLLGQYQNPDEEDIEALCKLMSTIGEIIDHPKAKEHMDAYFDMMLKLSTNQKLSPRVRYMLQDAIDLRKNKWQQRRKVEGPKKIEEVHRDAAHERQAQAQAGRSGRGPVISSTPRRGPAIDYGPRGSSVLPTPSSQHMGNTRGFTSQTRGYGSQDFRHEVRHQFESRTLSMPQRSNDDDSITFGPKGGLARGMSMRGQPLVSSNSVAENPLLAGEHQRMASGSNGYNSAAAREEVSTRNVPEKLSGVLYDLPGPLDHNSRISDRPSSTTVSTGRLQAPPATCSGPKPLSETDLRGKSLYALKEYYSAKDEDEVAFCIKELNCPSFYSSMVSVWVTDSFERRDAERDLLAGLLVSLNKSRHSLLSQAQLIAGFESVLSSLEDAVNDAPRAPEFLGRLFARIVLEDVVSLREIGRLICEGGEEHGSLLESGLASEVLGGILESIKTESGGAALDEIRTGSELRLEEFLPPRVGRARNKLEAFL